MYSLVTSLPNSSLSFDSSTSLLLLLRDSRFEICFVKQSIILYCENSNAIINQWFTFCIYCSSVFAMSLPHSLVVSLVLQISLICTTYDSTLLNSNESTPSTLPLRTLQEILQNRIIQKKGEMHKSHNRVYNDGLWTEIETIQWVLAQILMLLQQSSSTKS
jgi:hypothetical protein